MIYKAPIGKQKDSVTFYYAGKYYIFSMYSPSGREDDYTAVWLAESSDGVHYSDVGVVIKAAFPIWAMSVICIQNKFLLNHGTFAEDGTQSVIRFWESDDLIDWHCMPELDLRPDPRYFPLNSRLDCMDIVPTEEDGKTVYYGFATGVGGFLKSTDGYHWQSLGPVTLDWTPFNAPLSCSNGDLEVGGCRKIGKYWYLLGGCFNHLGMSGYGSCTLRSDSPAGPFVPDGARFRLYGGSSRWVSFWSRFCDSPDGILISNSYIYTGYSYERGETWIPPLKRLMTDSGDHLYPAYWEGNEKLKGKPIRIPAVFELDSPAQTVFSPLPPGEGAELLLVPETANPAKGFILTGKLKLDTPSWTAAAPSAGFYLEETEDTGAALLFSGSGTTSCGEFTIAPNRKYSFAADNENPPISAAVTGIEIGKTCTFRLLVRKNMFDLYLDDRHAMTFNSAHRPDYDGHFSGRFGFIVCGGKARFSELELWEMNLPED